MPSESQLDWRSLTQASLRGIRGRTILAVRADGKGYYGSITEVTADYVMLSNGSQWQRLMFFDSPTQFSLVEPPVKSAPRLANRKLL